jgi:hypothetical protein
MPCCVCACALLCCFCVPCAVLCCMQMASLVQQTLRVSQLTRDWLWANIPTTQVSCLTVVQHMNDVEHAY